MTSGLASNLALSGIVLSWLGASLFVLSDGRWGIATGLLAAGLGLAVVEAAMAGLTAGAITASGAVLSALASHRGGVRRGWGVLPPGSTSRIVLCAVLGTAAVWLGSRLLSETADWQSRAAQTLVVALAGARSLTSTEIGAALGGASLVVLAAGGMAGQRGGGSEAVLLGAACAVALNLIPRTFRRERESDVVMADG